ncbi:MAG: DNA gyrase subunit A [Clostridiales bacterium]|nr:DNA gyrase subunit A [Clostridiales bacterium]
MDNKKERKNIIEVDIEKEMKSSFLDYSMSVIVSRALPDARDGLKPVHRRILYSMYNSGLTPDKGYSKSAATVGDVLKYFHPHGEASVYDALVRLAQDFSMRYPLVDGQGNFGSLDGDPPAAMRYTEARMSKISMTLMDAIEKDTVNFVPNYDGRYKEPEVLPSRMPNLLLNGSVGIAVGMATNIPPHNLGEVIDAACYLIDNPDATLDELMMYVKGPDFPTGGIIVGRRGIRAAYATGRGRIKVRAKCEIEETKSGRFQIVVTEIPYMVNKQRLVESIANLVKDKRVDGISYLSDHSDRMGLKIVIELKKEANPQVVLNRLYSFTQLENNFSVMMIALVDGEPKCMSLWDMLDCYVTFQRDVVERRTRFDLNRCRRRAHILEGLKIAVDNIDEVVNILRSSKNETVAKERLGVRFGLSDEQTQAIVDMRLGRLTGLEREKINAELEDLYSKIEEFERILSSDENIYEIVKKELCEVRNTYSDERRTQIETVEDELDIEDLIENEECIYTLTRHGYIKRLPTTAYRAQRRGGKGITAMTTREEDIVSTMFASMTHNHLLFFTDMGRVYRLKGYQVPHASRTAKGTNLVNLLQLEPDEKVTAMLPVENFDDSQNLVFVTRKGTAKRIGLSAFGNIRKGGLKAVVLREDDALVSVLMTDGESEIMIASDKGKAVRFKEDEIRIMGRAAAGVRGIKLGEDDIVVGAVAIKGDEHMLTVTDRGYGKITPVSDYNTKRRAGMGVACHGITEKTGSLAAIRIICKDEDVMLITDAGIMIRVPAEDIRVCGRVSQGVILMRADEESRVIDIETVSGENEE